MAKFRRFEGAFSWFFIELETHSVEHDMCFIATAQRPKCSYNKGYIAYFYCACTKRPYFCFWFEDVFTIQLIFCHRKSKRSAIFLLPVYLAYWPKKLATCWATHVDHFHQVLSWYDYQSPSYSVVGADTLRDLVTLTYDLLTMDSGQTWLVMWSTPPPSFKILRLSVLDLWVMMSAIGHR